MVRERMPDPAMYMGLVCLQVEKHPEIQAKLIAGFLCTLLQGLL